MRRRSFPPYVFPLVILLGLPITAPAVELLRFEGTATIYAEAWEGWNQDDIHFETCDDARSWTDTTPLDEQILCSVAPGYGYARCHTRVESTVTADGFSTSAGGGGSFFDDNWLRTTGDFDATYRQTYDFRTADAIVVRVTGSLGQEYGSLSELEISQDEDTIAYFAPPADTYEASLLLNDEISLASGDYRIELNIVGRPIPLDTYGGAGATVEVSFAAATSVTPTSWARIKGLYRVPAPRSTNPAQ